MNTINAASSDKYEVQPEHKHQYVHDASDTTSDDVNLSNELYNSSAIDPILAKKMALINQAIDEIGMTGFQWKLFFFNGFGYAVDSLLVVCQSIAQPAVEQQFGKSNETIKWVALSSQIGLLAGAAIWGFSADVIGRKLAFNTSLLSCAAFVLIAGGMPTFASFCAMVAIYSAGAGGNYVLDATNFLEFLPVTHSWLVTFMSIWWAVGYTITGLLAWAFMSNFSCPPDEEYPQCTNSQNWGWRYLHFTAGGLVLVMSLARLLFIRMVQTPRWLIAQNQDADAYEILRKLAEKYQRPFSLTLERLEEKGRVLGTERSRWSVARLKKHFLGLFETKRLAWSYTVIASNWFVIGMVSPLYSVFLPYYLETRGVANSVSDGQSNYITWRDYAINQVAGLAGPIIAGVLVETRWVGRRGTLAIGALITMILQFGYTQISTPAENVGISAAITAASDIYYGTIYAYTPEILPTAHRATGYGLCVVVNRIGGIIGVLIGSYANVRTTAPLFVCASLFGLLVILSLMLPFESRGKRAI